jgi:hypothetical protein
MILADLMFSVVLATFKVTIKLEGVFATEIIMMIAFDKIFAEVMVIAEVAVPMPKEAYYWCPNTPSSLLCVDQEEPK